jgi:hypothetical protein
MHATKRIQRGRSGIVPAVFGAALMLAAVANHAATAYMLFDGDGSDEAGFVPPQKGKDPPPPPAHSSSGETYIPYPGPPATPQARTEKKKPPKPPVLFAKLTSDRGELDWNTRPNDLNNLLKSMKDMADSHFMCEVKSFSEVDTDPEKNPILYRSGHFRFSFSPEERQRLREYLLNGGMIILNTGMGSKPFYDAARKELEAIFPETPVQRLSPDHPILHAYYDLQQVEYRKGVRDAGYAGNEPWLEGVTIQCRTVAVISRYCMASGWDEMPDESIQAYSVDSARKLGVNIMAYAAAQRAWAKNVAQAMQYVDRDQPAAGMMSIAHVVYGGEWKTRHAGLSLLLQQFNSKTDIPVKFQRREVRLTDPSLFDSPLLYMTGHEDFRLTPEEVAALRKYLLSGGTLFAEACCGRKAFDVAFRRELGRALPDHPLAKMPADATIFALPTKLGDLAVTPALAAQNGNRGTLSPVLMGSEINGHSAVVYSPYGLAGGWEMSQSPYAFGYDNNDALVLGENILLHAITQ